MKKNVSEYCILKYRISLNKRLYEKKIIDLEVFQSMQQILINKINRISKLIEE